MCVTWNYPDNTLEAILYVKGTDGNIYPIRPLDDNSAVLSTLYNKFRDLGLTFLYDRSDEPKPVGNDFVATDETSEPVTTHADYDYAINDDSYVFAGAKTYNCKNGEVYVYPNDKVLTVSSLPCTLKLGHYLKYKITSGGGYYYAYGKTTTLEITEPGTYPVETIVIGGWSLGTPPPWYGYTAEVVVEESGSEYKITIKNFTFYTHDAAVKYKNWMNRPLATTIKLDEYGNGSKTLDITYLTDRIKALEQRVAELEALHNNE